MAKRSVKSQYVGIDVSARTLQVAIGGPDGVRDLEFSNDAEGHTLPPAQVDRVRRYLVVA